MEELTRTIGECIKNGSRLIEDAKYLRDFERYPSGSSLAILAQEEFEKAFILVLVRDDVLPWTDPIRRSIHNHECKHLIGVIMEWLGPPFEEAFERVKRHVSTWETPEIPSAVGKAINILRHEKIARFKDGYSEKEKEWDGIARQIAEGLVSRRKHQGMYIGVSRLGEIDSCHPDLVSKEMVEAEIEKAGQLQEFAEDANRGVVLSRGEYDLAKSVIKAVFEDLTAQKRV